MPVSAAIAGAAVQGGAAVVDTMSNKLDQEKVMTNAKSEIERARRTIIRAQSAEMSDTDLDPLKNKIDDLKVSYDSALAAMEQQPNSTFFGKGKLLLGRYTPELERKSEILRNEVITVQGDPRMQEFARSVSQQKMELDKMEIVRKHSSFDVGTCSDSGGTGGSDDALQSKTYFDFSFDSDTISFDPGANPVSADRTTKADVAAACSVKTGGESAAPCRSKTGGRAEWIRLLSSVAAVTLVATLAVAFMKTTSMDTITPQVKNVPIDPKKGSGKTAYFASLTDSEKIEVLKCTGLKEVDRFVGRHKEGKTAFFSGLTGEQKVDALKIWAGRTWKAQKGTGKTRFFANLKTGEKMEVLRLTGLKEVERFEGRHKEGKTGFFAELTQAQKCSALMKWHARRTGRSAWQAEPGTGKTAYFASLQSAEKMEVLKFTGLLEVDRFTGVQKEGKTKFFAGLAGAKKVEALEAWEISRPVPECVV